jgi:multiple sugar transport system substrate-binding protein
MLELLRRPGRSRRGIGLAAIAAICALAVAACGSSGSDDKSAGDGSFTLEVLPSLHGSFKEVVGAYEKSHPKAKITLVQGPQDVAEYATQLATQRLGARTPDLFINLDILSDKLADSGFSEDLVAWFNKGKGLTRKSFSEQFLSSYVPRKAPQTVTGLPVSADATVVFYNKKIFRQAGIPFPKDDWTYEQFLAAAQKISVAGKGKFYGVSALPDGDTPPSVWQAQYQPMIKAFGGYVYDAKTNTTGIGKPEAIKAWELLMQPWSSGAMPRYGVQAGAAAPTFAGGQYGMQVSVRALIPAYRQGLGNEWDVAQMPVVNGVHPVGGGSYGLSMSKPGKHKEAAWAFLNWFYSNNGGIKLLQANYSAVPPTIEGIQSGAWRSLPPAPANVDAFSAAIKDAVIAPKLPGKAQAALDDAVKSAVEKVALKHVPVKDAFEEAGQKVDAALKQEGS